MLAYVMNLSSPDPTVLRQNAISLSGSLANDGLMSVLLFIHSIYTCR